MVVFLRRATLVVGLLSIAGCITDELAVYQDSVVGKEAMKPYLGTYHVEAWPGDMRPTSIAVTQEEDKFSFSYALGDRKVNVNFVLSKIPGSRKDLYLLSLPAQKDTEQANMFFVGQAGKERTSIWAVFSSLPVAQEHLDFTDGKAKAEDVKKFLKQYADAFVEANEPQVALKKTSG